MAIPVATTTIDVLRPPDADDYAEPYSGTRTADLGEVATGIRAVIDGPWGRQTAQGGEQTVTGLRFVADPCGVRSTDYLRDAPSGVLYRIIWCLEFPGSHAEGGLELVEGLV